MLTTQPTLLNPRSMLVGAILSWGLMWPLIERRAGDWYPAGLDSHDFQGLFGYKVRGPAAITWFQPLQLPQLD